MLEVDEFESVFRSAIKEPYHYRPVELRSILLITDLADSDSSALEQQLRQFSPVLQSPETLWQRLNGSDFRTTEELLQRVEQAAPELIISYRNLHSEAWRYPHSLGEHLDVLLNISKAPVLIIPHPGADYAASHALQQTRSVMAITDHLTADDRLVNYAVAFCQPDARLYLSHIEDQQTFERMIEAVGKIRRLDTDVAREQLGQQLLKEPQDYINSCHAVLKKSHSQPPEVVAHVQFGHSLSEYHRLIDAHQIDLLVMNTQDDDHPAMRGMVYPLAVQLRQIPLLMV